MTRMVFIGRVHPTAAKVDFSHQKFPWKDTSRNLDMEVQVGIVGSQISVTCDGPNLVLDMAHVAASDLANSAVNSLAFSSGIGFRAILDEVITDGVRSRLLLQHPTLARPQLSGPEVWDIIVGNPSLFIAMNELIGTLHTHHLASINTARAVERLRDYLTDPTWPREKKWKEFNRILRLDESASRAIMNLSLRDRHGETAFTPGSALMGPAELAFTIMLRVLLLKKHGLTELPASSEFPILSG